MVRSIYELLLKRRRVVIEGQLGPYTVTQVLKPFLFRAYTPQNIPVLVKTESNLDSFDREASIYDFKSVRDSSYIRELREVVDNDTDKCMIFEWMDTNLWGVHRQKRELGPSFVRLTAKSVLEALRVLGDLDGQAAVHNDINVKTVMVGGLRTEAPLVKLSNFDRAISPTKIGGHRLNPLGIHAPEIWKGASPTPASDVWAVGATLASFLASKGLFGTLGHRLFISRDPEEMKFAWPLSKIIRLLGPIKRDEPSKFTDMFNLAEHAAETSTLMGTLEEELTKAGTPSDCIEFVRYLLTLDHEKRPTAEQALRHPWLRSLK